MAQISAMAECAICFQRFSFNPKLVPAIEAAGGAKLPVCRTCVERINVLLELEHRPPVQILPGAYEPEEVN